MDNLINTECAICLETYNIKEKEMKPYILSKCGHDFCLKCIKKLKERLYHELKCPICKSISSFQNIAINICKIRYLY